MMGKSTKSNDFSTELTLKTFYPLKRVWGISFQFFL